MANLGKKKIFVKQLGLVSFDGVLLMKGTEAYAGMPLHFRPMPGDTLTIQFVGDDSKPKKEAA